MLPGAQALTVRLARLVSYKLYFFLTPTKLSQVPGKPCSFGETSNRSDARDKGDAHKVGSGSNTSLFFAAGLFSRWRRQNKLGMTFFS